LHLLLAYTVDESGENTIVVAPGANAKMKPSDLFGIQSLIKEEDYLLMQLEIPLQTVIHMAQTAKTSGVKVILNPAPAMKLPDELLKDLFLITPNESEVKFLTGIDVRDEISAEEAAKLLYNKGVLNIIISMGDKGAFWHNGKSAKHFEAFKTKALDTTAAGDTFNGALAVALSEGKTFEESIIFANKAAAISVSRPGAQASIPYKNEL
jgi:ribokinase